MFCNIQIEPILCIYTLSGFIILISFLCRGCASHIDTFARPLIEVSFSKHYNSHSTAFQGRLNVITPIVRPPLIPTLSPSPPLFVKNKPPVLGSLLQ